MDLAWYQISGGIKRKINWVTTYVKDAPRHGVRAARDGGSDRLLRGDAAAVVQLSHPPRADEGPSVDSRRPQVPQTDSNPCVHQFKNRIGGRGGGLPARTRHPSSTRPHPTVPPAAPYPPSPYPCARVVRFSQSPVLDGAGIGMGHRNLCNLSDALGLYLGARDPPPCTHTPNTPLPPSRFNLPTRTGFLSTAPRSPTCACIPQSRGYLCSRHSRHSAVC